jgi:tRNA nucleotidyltransferase (CCA-adding enzyme)
VGVTPWTCGPALACLRDVVTSAGGRPVVVGGAVRDHLRGHAPKDVDVEVYGLSLEALERALSVFDVYAVGRSFGVLKVNVAGAQGVTETFDVSLPRRDSKRGTGHRGFVVEVDETMSFTDAAARRDFTINAMGIDLASGALMDPHGGANDLAAGVLRHVSDAFDEDPLRVLRAAQFAARFSLQVHADTVVRCRSLGAELSTLPGERIGEEMRKLLLQAPWPSLGLQVLKQVGALEVLFPELHALVGCPQEFDWHPEGDVWTHSLMVLDEAAALSRDEPVDVRGRVVLAALCHDLGKPNTTAVIGERITSRDHEAQGEAPTRALLTRWCTAGDVIDDVISLVREHLKPFQLWSKRADLGDAAIRRLALRVPIPLLALVSRADAFGRTTPDALRREDDATPWLRAQAERLEVAARAPTPLLLGRHLQACGLAPGPHYRPLLEAAFEAQLEGVFEDVEGAQRWLQQRLAQVSA